MFRLDQCEGVLFSSTIQFNSRSVQLHFAKELALVMLGIQYEYPVKSMEEN